VLASAFDSLLVVDGADLVLHGLHLEVGRILAQGPENVGHFAHGDAVGQNAGFLSLFAVEVIDVFAIFVAGVAQLGVVELVLHVLLEFHVADQRYQPVFLGLVHQPVSQLELAVDGLFVDLPDFDREVLAATGENEAFLGFDAECAQESGVRHDADVFVGVAVDGFAYHADDAVFSRENLELVFFFGLALLRRPELLDARLADFAEIGALVGMLEALLGDVE